MDLFETINTRKTIRKYTQDPIPMEDIKKIIDAGRLAPSATNSQNWKFIAITNQEIKEKMRSAVVEGYDNLAEMVDEKSFKDKMTGYKGVATFFADAPVVIAIVESERISFVTEKMKELNFSSEELRCLRPDSSMLSLGAAIENMSLATHALGYGSCWLVAPIIGSKTFSKLLKLDDNEHVMSLLSIGVPLDKDAKGPKKKTLEEVMQIID